MKNTFTLILFMLLFSIPTFAQLDEEGFEGTWTVQTGAGPGGPTDWAIVNILTAGPVQTWSQGTGTPTTPFYEGAHSATIQSENVTNGTTSEDWLITKAFVVPANAELHFFSRLGVPGDQNTQYKIMMSANTGTGQQVNTGNYAAIQTWTELQLNPSQLEWTEKVINIPATYPVGTTVYLAFVMQGDNGDRWAIDNVKVVSKCLNPTALTAVPSNTSADLSWGNPSGATAWEIEVVPATGSATGVGVEYDEALPYTAPGLTASTAYKYYVRALCDDNTSGWVGPFNFTTTVCPIQNTCNYIFTVWDAFGDGWNGHTMTVSQNGVTMGTLALTSGAGPNNITIPVCDGQPFQLFWNNLTGGWPEEVGVSITNNFGQVIYTKNPGTGAPNTALYTTTIDCDTPACLPVSGLTVSALSQNSATLNWTGPNTGNWEYYVVPNGTAAPTAATSGTATTTKPVTVNSVAGGTAFVPSTTYQYYVRIACSGGAYSAWAGPYTFTTTQNPAILNYAQTFESYTNDWQLVNGSQTNKWVVGSAVSNSASNSLYISDNGTAHNYNLTSTSTVHAYRDIFIPNGTAEINVSFDWRNNGQSGQDYMRVWFAPTSYTPAAGTQTTLQLAGGATVATQIGGNFQLSDTWTNYNYTANVSNYGGTIRRVIFEWRNNANTGTQAPAAVDNININIVTCPQPLALTAGGITSTTALLGWTNQGTADEWEVYVVPTGAPAPTAATIGASTDDNPYLTPPLTPSTTYQFYVRAVCGTSDKSVWSGPYSFTTAIANDNCEGAMVLPVNPGEDCVQSVQTLFTGATASPQPICTGVNGADIWYTFTAEGPKHNISADFSNLPVGTLENSTQGVSLSLYAGNVCTALDTPLYCVTNNYIMATNLVAGNEYTVRVTINNATPNLSYPFTMCVTTPEASSGAASACEITTINFSFESPNLPDAQFYPPMVHQNAVPGWKTTATDGKIEIWHTFPTGPSFEGFTAYEGDQFIELNANQVSGVYQDYVTPPGTVFSYGFAHRARTSGTGQDVCQLLAGPPAGPWLPVGAPVASGGAAWTYNTGSYTVPAGQNTTRFIFQSVSSAQGDPTIGNFLDAITFTANVGIITNSPVVLDCENNIATIEANGTGTWVAHSGNPAATVIADDQENSTTVSGFTVPGTYYYEWSTALCSSTLEIDYQGGVISQPVVVDVTYCQGDTPAQLTATTSGTINVLHWFADATGGTELTEAPTPTTTAVGTTSYYVSQTFYNCESPRAEITVTVNPLPAAPAAADIEYCQNAAAAPLTATADAGSTLVWYTVANGGTALTGAPTPLTTTVGTTVYYVAQENAQGCESARTAIAVTINPLITPETDFTLPVTVCGLSGTVTPTPATGFITGGTYTSTTGLSINATTGVIDLAASTPGTYTVTYTIAANAANCMVTASSTADIIITAATVPGLTFTFADVCGNAANQLPSTGTGFTAGGTYSSTTGLDINSATGEINVAGSTPGSYIVTYTYAGDAAGCIAAGTSTESIVITPVFAPVAEFSYNDNYCYGQGAVLPSFAADFTAGGTFTASNGLTINPSTGEINVNTATPGVYTVTYTVPADPSICSAGSSFTDTFSIGGEIAFTLEGNCEAADYFIRAESTVNGGEFSDNATFEWTTANGIHAGGDNDYLNVSEFADLNAGEEVFPMQFILTVSDGICENSVVFEVPDIACMIQRGISPNGDDKNQTFDLTSMGVRKLVIFNRYGKEVYSKNNYSNEWYGQTDGGDELPTGTYYYMFERTNGETRTGWIYINRED